MLFLAVPVTALPALGIIAVASRPARSGLDEGSGVSTR